ncbi:MAG: HAMP domain-containing sensor histidine kinase [Candidatus Paceibacterota bacterium]
MEPVLSDIVRCEFLEPARLLFISGNVPPLVYYTHLPNIVFALFIAFLVLFKNKTALANRILFGTIMAFVFWVIFSLIFWATNRADLIMYGWLIDILVEPLVHIGVLYLLYVLITGHDLSFAKKLFFALLYLPVPLLLPTPFTLAAFDTASCLATEGPVALYYTYFVEITVTILLLVFLVRRFFATQDREKRTRIFYLGTGGILLLFAFSWGNIIGSFTENWELGQYGLLGMPIFISFLVYSIVRFNLFNIKLFATQALVVVSWCALFSLLFINEIEAFRFVVIANTVIFAILGYQVIRSVKREVEQRKHLEQLTKQLQNANKRLKVLDQLKSEFVSIASHQLRSPLTAIRGYASMILEGSYGKMPKKAKEAVERIAESSRFMALSVEDYLNVSRIQSGSMKYNLSEFDLREVAKTIADDMRAEGMKQGLLITFKSNVTSKCLTKADIGKTRQIIQNLVDNALKYTKKGSIEIRVHDKRKPKRIYVEVTDTGIGMSKETLANIFGKFERARNANEVNVIGTGLGLYVAKKMAEDMGGTVTATSEGEGKGSTFTVELPYIC